MNRRGGTGEIVDLVHLDEERLGDVVPNKLETVVSSRCTMFSRRPVKKLSRQTTLWPSARSRSQRWEPIKPAPPVTRMRMVLGMLGRGLSLRATAHRTPGGIFHAAGGQLRNSNISRMGGLSEGVYRPGARRGLSPGCNGDTAVWPGQHRSGRYRRGAGALGAARGVESGASGASAGSAWLSGGSGMVSVL